MSYLDAKMAATKMLRTDMASTMMCGAGNSAI